MTDFPHNSIQSSIENEVGNISSVSPTARLRILDLGQGGAEASETILGEELELRVDIYPPYSEFMILSLLEPEVT